MNGNLFFLGGVRAQSSIPYGTVKNETVTDDRQTRVAPKLISFCSQLQKDLLYAPKHNLFWRDCHLQQRALTCEVSQKKRNPKGGEGIKQVSKEKSFLGVGFALVYCTVCYTVV